MIDLEKLMNANRLLRKISKRFRDVLPKRREEIAEDQALLHALMGAFQQCDAFAKELDNDEPEMVSDVENSEDPGEAIDGTD
jgi:transposase